MPTINRGEISYRIITLRGQKVILDGDLARLYRTGTKTLNKAVKRNRARFPADFCFQMTQEEFTALRFQIGTSNTGRGGRRYRNSRNSGDTYLIPQVPLRPRARGRGWGGVRSDEPDGSDKSDRSDKSDITQEGESDAG